MTPPQRLRVCFRRASAFLAVLLFSATLHGQQTPSEPPKDTKPEEGIPVTDPLTGCVAWKKAPVTGTVPVIPTVPETGWVAGRLDTVTAPETGWVAWKNVPVTPTAPLIPTVPETG